MFGVSPSFDSKAKMDRTTGSQSLFKIHLVAFVVIIRAVEILLIVLS